MKKMNKTILSLLLVLVMTAGLFTVTAFADGFTSDLPGSVTAEEGETVTLSVSFSGTPNNDNAIQWFHNGSCVMTGSYTYSFVASQDTSGSVFVRIGTAAGELYSSSTCQVTVKPHQQPQPTMEYKTANVTVEQGKNYSETEIASVSSMIQSTKISGKAPSGITVTQYDTYFTMKGKATETGTFTLKYDCTTEGGKAEVTIVFSSTTPTLRVTKSPSGEKVREGESALFIAAAEGYSKIEWRVVTADGSNCWRDKNEIESNFKGVIVNTYMDDSNRNCLTLKNIPLSMNGYYIQAKYWNMDQSKTEFTSEKACLLTVTEIPMNAPTITTQPTGGEKKMGRAMILTTGASDPNGGVLSYQWYKSNTNTTNGGMPIAGATGTTFSVPQTEGTAYYYATIVSTKSGKTSPAATTQIAKVTYTAAETPAPTATPAVTPTPSPAVTATPAPGQTQTPAQTQAPTTSTTPSPNGSSNVTVGPGTAQKPAQTTQKKSFNVLIWVLILLLLLLAMVALYLIMTIMKKNGKGAAAAPVVMPTVWHCPSCGAKNKGKFCSDCGTPRPRDPME